MSSHTPGPDPEATHAKETGVAKDVELLKVMVVRDGKQVNAQWAIHPQLKHDLKPEEWKEVSDLMAQVAGIVGGRFTKLLTEAEPDEPGHA